VGARYFRTKAELRAWFQRNHHSSAELVVGYYKRSTGKASITWQESVDEALCFGWIDGIRRSVDEERYTNRFTPRRPGSNWSAINIRRARELIDEGRMTAPGLRAFEARREDRSAVYSYEQRPATLDPPYERRLRANRRAWADFQSRPPHYRKTAIHWVMSAKREETRERRLGVLIESSAAGEPVPPLRPPEGG
jgi:uncharacterized protein YdeI (YjbR/CyaY-like superfamily)